MSTYTSIHHVRGALLGPIRDLEHGSYSRTLSVADHHTGDAPHDVTLFADDPDALTLRIERVVRDALPLLRGAVDTLAACGRDRAAGELAEVMRQLADEAR